MADSEDKLFAYHYPTSPHFEPSPWLSCPSFSKLEEYDPEVVAQLNEMDGPQLVQVLGQVILTTCASTAAVFLVCRPPSRASIFGMAAAVSFCLPMMILATSEKKRKGMKN